MLTNGKIFKLFVFLLFLYVFSLRTEAQYISIYGVNTIQVLTDNTTFDFNPSSSIGGEISYTNYLALGFNYNLGADYLITDDANIYLLQTGISKILMSPSSFNHAKNKESVNMITNNWLTNYNINFYNGIITVDSVNSYVFAAEPSYELAFVLGKKKKLFIGGELAVRYSIYSGDIYTINNAISFPVKLGIRYEL